MSKITTSRKSKKSSQPDNALLPKLDKKSIAAFLKTNPSVDLKKLNTFNSTSLEALNWDNLDRAVLLPQLKALQRLVRLTHQLETAEALYEKGLHAAIQIAAISEHKFIEQYASLFTPNDLSAEQQAKQVHQRALARKAKAVHTYTALVQHKAAHYQATRFDNLGAATDANYGNLPSYQDLFGDLDFCTCDECRSIFSPAAYFVDLMRLQDNYISKDPEFQTSTPLLLDRRPDLWEIPLDCKHTNTLVPKLQIVNKVLLKALGNNVTYEQLANTNYPFNLPFHLSLTQIALYLSQNQQTLPSVWQALIPNLDLNADLNIALQRLGLSPEQWALYSSTPQTDPKVIAPLYGLPATQDPVSMLTAIDTFLKQTGLSYVQLEELLYEDLSDQELNKELNNAFFINSDLNNTAKGPIGLSSTKQLPNVAIYASPNAVVYQHNLYCFHQGANGNKGNSELRYSLFKESTWQPDVLIPNTLIGYSPSVVSYQDKQLYCFYQGKTGNEFLYKVFENGEWQEEPNKINLGIIFSPSAVVYKDQLYCFSNDAYTPQLNYSVLESDATWKNQPVPGTKPSHSPSAVSYQDKQLYCFYQGATDGKDNNQLRYTVFNGKWLDKDIQINNVRIYGSPSAVVYGNKLYCFYQRADNKNNGTGELWYAVLGQDGISWENNQVIGVNISTDPNAVIYQGNLYCFYQGRKADGSNDGLLYYTMLWMPQELTNLTLERLDHINRFVRLAQALGWSFTDLDWALRTIGAIINTANKNVPVIDNDVLPYLVWIQNLYQQYQLTINQSCALLVTLKDVGQKNGATFFDQIFNNTNVLNPPSWKDSTGNYSLIWNVPQLGNSLLPLTQDVQIQNALAAALHLSQDDLLLVANQVLQTLGINRPAAKEIK